MRERRRQTDRDRERETERERDRQRERETDRQRERERDNRERERDNREREREKDNRERERQKTSTVHTELCSRLSHQPFVGTLGVEMLGLEENLAQSALEMSAKRIDSSRMVLYFNREAFLNVVGHMLSLQEKTLLLRHH